MRGGAVAAAGRAGTSPRHLSMDWGAQAAAARARTGALMTSGPRRLGGALVSLAPAQVRPPVGCARRPGTRGAVKCMCSLPQAWRWRVERWRGWCGPAGSRSPAASPRACPWARAGRRGGGGAARARQRVVPMRRPRRRPVRGGRRDRGERVNARARAPRQRARARGLSAAGPRGRRRGRRRGRPAGRHPGPHPIGRRRRRGAGARRGCQRRRPGRAVRARPAGRRGGGGSARDQAAARGRPAGRRRRRRREGQGDRGGGRHPAGCVLGRRRGCGACAGALERRAHRTHACRR